MRGFIDNALAVSQPSGLLVIGWIADGMGGDLAAALHAESAESTPARWITRTRRSDVAVYLGLPAEGGEQFGFAAYFTLPESFRPQGPATLSLRGDQGAFVLHLDLDRATDNNQASRLDPAMLAGMSRELAWLELKPLWNRLLQAQPGSAYAHIEYSKALKSAGDAFGALEEALQARQIAPDDLGIALEVAHCYEEMGDFRTALELIDQAGAAWPYRCVVHLWRGRLLAAAGEADAAVNAYARAATAPDATAETWLTVLQFLRYRNRWSVGAGLVLADPQQLLPNPELVVMLVEFLVREVRQQPVRYVGSLAMDRTLALLLPQAAQLPSATLWLFVEICVLLERDGDALQIVEDFVERAGIAAGGLDRNDLGACLAAVRARLAERPGSGALDAEGVAVLSARASACSAFTLASLCGWLALLLEPARADLLINASMAALARSRVNLALRVLDGLGATPEGALRLASWPAFDGQPWPLAAVPGLAAVLETHLPEGRSWPRISIICPTLNQCAYIEDCLRSLTNQAYPNLELIVVDGGSRDGTMDVVDRYRGAIAHLISEADRGQSEAINKGLRLATGEIVSWLNSDDMLAPAALHMVALRYLQAPADLLVGLCIEHRDRQIVRISAPAALAADFSVERLGAIFDHWLKGDFLYQPEVFLTRSLLERVGTLDESLQYSMDYDLWLRCARAGARPVFINWPLALFRKHPEQKTANTWACRREQLAVASGIRGHEGAAPRAAAVRERWNRHRASRQEMRVTFALAELKGVAGVAGRAPQSFRIGGRDYHVSYAMHAGEAQHDCDLVIYPFTGYGHTSIADARVNYGGAFLAAWLLDDCWDLRHCLEVAAAADFMVPVHQCTRNYLQQDGAVALAPVPLMFPAMVTGPATAEGERLLLAVPAQLLGGRGAQVRALLAAWHGQVEILEYAMGLTWGADEKAETMARIEAAGVVFWLPHDSELPVGLYWSLAAGRAVLLPPELGEEAAAALAPGWFESGRVQVLADWSAEALRAALAAASRGAAAACDPQTLAAMLAEGALHARVRQMLAQLEHPDAEAETPALG